MSIFAFLEESPLFGRYLKNRRVRKIIEERLGRKEKCHLIKESHIESARSLLDEGYDFEVAFQEEVAHFEKVKVEIISSKLKQHIDPYHDVWEYVYEDGSTETVSVLEDESDLKNRTKNKKIVTVPEEIKVIRSTKL